MSAKVFVCITGINGESYVGRAEASMDAKHVIDVFAMKMVYEPETKRRYFSFSPARPLCRCQTMRWDDFMALGQGLPYYLPAQDVCDAYAAFTSNAARVDKFMSAYLTECGPCKEWLDNNIPVSERKIPARVGKVIKAFEPELNEGAV